MKRETKLKSGPKVDLVSKAKDIRAKLPKGYKLISCGQHRSTFKHSCGTVFEMGNRPLLIGSGKCPCLHKKLTKHTIKSLQEWHIEHGTNYLVKSINGKQAKLTCCTCKYAFETRKYYNRRCPNCYPNIFASRERSPDEYKDWLKENHPELKLLGKYSDSRTRTKYKHIVCGKTFEVSPSAVTRKAFRCPQCAPKTRASYFEFKLGKRTVKIRGKEYVALTWILANTSIRPDEIEVDSEGTLPKLKYWDGRRQRAYKPDFYVRSKNIVVEVKDLCTIGLAGHFFYKSKQHLWKTACAKAQSCIEAGFKFNMLVFDKTNTRVKLPKNWHLLTQRKALKLLGLV